MAKYGLKPAVCRRNIKAGKLHARNLSIGSRPTYFVEEADLQAFLDQAQVAPPVPRRRSRAKPKDRWSQAGAIDYVGTNQARM
jgi:hypothetical protein